MGNSIKKICVLILAIVICITTIALNFSIDNDSSEVNYSDNTQMWDSIDCKLKKAFGKKDNVFFNDQEFKLCSLDSNSINNDVEKIDEIVFLENNYDELKSILSQVEMEEFESAVKNKADLLERGILIETEEGELILSSDCDYQLQAAGISLDYSYRRIWFFTLPIGIDIKFGSASYAYSFLSIAALVNLLSTVVSIKFIWYGGINATNATRLGLDPNELKECATILRSLSTAFVGIQTLADNLAGLIINGKIPVWLITAVDVAFRAIVSLVKNSGVVGFLITTVLRMITPSVTQCFKIISECVDKGKLPILHYTLIVYDSYELV